MCLRKIYESIEFVHYIFVMRSGRLYAWQNIKLTSGRNHKDSFLFPAFSLNLSILCSIFPTAWSQFCPSSSTFLDKLYTHCYTSSRAVTWESQGLADQWWEWGPFLSHWQEERSSERRVCFHWGEANWELKTSSHSLWEYWAVYRQAPTQFGMLPVKRHELHHPWTHQSRDFHKQRSQKKKVLWILNKDLLYMFFHWSAKQSDIAPHSFVHIHSEGFQRRLQCIVVLFNQLNLREKLF